MYMYNWMAKGVSCILFDLYSSFKFVGTHEHDNVLLHVSMLINLVFDKTCLHSMHDNKQIIFQTPYKHY